MSRWLSAQLAAARGGAGTILEAETFNSER